MGVSLPPLGAGRAATTARVTDPAKAAALADLSNQLKNTNWQGTIHISAGPVKADLPGLKVNFGGSEPLAYTFSRDLSKVEPKGFLDNKLGKDAVGVVTGLVGGVEDKLFGKTPPPRQFVFNDINNGKASGQIVIPDLKGRKTSVNFTDFKRDGDRLLLTAKAGNLSLTYDLTQQPSAPPSWSPRR
jgi:hypothetical protein